MKQQPGPTDFWRFPITGEETWAGVNVCHSFASVTGFIHHCRRPYHGTPTQQVTQLTQGLT